MKTAVLALTLTLGLAACSAGTDTPTAQPTATVPGGQQEKPQPAAVPGKPLPEALPEGFMLTFPYHFTRRQIVDTRERGKRLRYTVEFLDGDVESIAGSMAESAKAAGFESIQTKRLSGGRIHFVATKAGYGELSSLLSPVGKQKLANPAARGTVVLGWPAPATEVAPGPAPAQG